jgi:hypothetical protein
MADFDDMADAIRRSAKWWPMTLRAAGRTWKLTSSSKRATWPATTP